ncbi:MAG: 2Fe-2S iron-sulfur cluster-binding protein [Runella sp.]
MTQITYIEPSGIAKTYELPLGATIMEGAIQNGVAGIVAQCGGSCSCATCHVYIDEAFVEVLPDMEEEEDEMLEGTTAERKPNSRLSCQVRVSPKLNGLIVHIPEKQ